jgi:hypothetical protein
MHCVAAALFRRRGGGSVSTIIIISIIIRVIIIIIESIIISVNRISLGPRCLPAQTVFEHRASLHSSVAADRTIGRVLRHRAAAESGTMVRGVKAEHQKHPIIAT